MKNPETKQKEAQMLPNDLNVESALLGAILRYDTAYLQIQDRLSKEDFYSPKNQSLFDCIKSLNDEGQKITLTSVVNKSLSLCPDVWSAFEIAELANKYNGDNIEYLASILNTLRTKRVVWGILQQGANKSREMDSNIDEVIEETRKALDDVSTSGSEAISSLNSSIDEVLKIAEDNQNPQTARRGTPTGFEYFDEKGGFQPSDLIIIAAESSQGKTSLAMSIAKYATEQGERIAFYSMEMPKTQLTARLLAMEEVGVSSNEILSRYLLPKTLADLKNKANNLSYLCGNNLFFDDRSTSNIDTIIASIRTMAIKHHINGAFIDYLQILNVNQRVANKEQQMGEVARKLKNLAKELNIWIVALSQLNRDSRDNVCVPSVNRLRDSGQINEAADLTILIYRPEAILSNSTTRTFPEPFKDYDTKGNAMIIVGKGRNIGTGSFLCGFNERTTRFYPKNVEKVACSGKPF